MCCFFHQVRVEEKDKRQDLFALATSYIGQLKARWSTLVAEDEFHEKVSNPEKPVKARQAKEDSSGGSTSTSKEAKSKPATNKTEPMEVPTSSTDAQVTSNATSTKTSEATSSNNQGGSSKSSKPSPQTESATSSPVAMLVKCTWIIFGEYSTLVS